MHSKKIPALLIFIILIIFLGTSTAGTTVPSSEIVLIPLDSRPCNTDYIMYAAGALDKKLSYPKDFIDNYNQPSRQDNLYKFLYDSLETADTYIIFTNQIINGGLIASRDPLSYIGIEEKINDFTNFLELAKEYDKQVFVVSVLPRVIPSQFTDLWNFRDELISFSNQFGSIDLDVFQNAYQSPPKEIIAKYLSIYSGSDLIVNQMKDSVDKGLIDLFIIGQDDTYKESITNHQINKYLQYSNEKIIVQPGADELTKLILAKIIRNETSNYPLDINLKYTDTSESKEIRAYESTSTEKRADQILQFLNIKNNTSSENIAIIHNKAGTSETSINSIYNNVNKKYLSLIDIAYINRGDPELFIEPSFLKNLNGYSGWNTVGNSLGSEFANFVIYDFLEKNLSSYTQEKQVEILTNYYKLLYIHFSDDYLYQGILRNQLNSYLISEKENTSFISNKVAADKFLQQMFQNESVILDASLSGAYNAFGSVFHIKYEPANISLPWKRTFEARIIPNLTITKGR